MTPPRAPRSSSAGCARRAPRRACAGGAKWPSDGREWRRGRPVGGRPLFRAPPAAVPLRPGRQTGQRRAPLRAPLRGRRVVARGLPRRGGRIGRHDRRQGRRKARERGAGPSATRSRRRTSWPAERRGGRRDASCSTRSGVGRSRPRSAAWSCRRPRSPERLDTMEPRIAQTAREVAAAPRPATGRCRRRTAGGARLANADSGANCPGGGGSHESPLLTAVVVQPTRSLKRPLLKAQC
jgi:hypothetical protein